MSTLSLRLPDSLHAELRKLAEQEGISINQLVASAAAEKLSALKTESYLKARAKAGNRKEFEAILARVPDVPAIADDQIE
ncbi:MAG: toxin-antitoxin system HicB family antitoxin [Gammaproteobacteria bacterium]|nr:toxin-antitoxin system HicB family antitoxin [Gammaproteobacteria bacterium]